MFSIDTKSIGVALALALLLGALGSGERWCPVCLWRKVTRLMMETISILNQIQHDHKVVYIFLTLTMKNASMDKLRASIEHLSQSWDRLTQTPQWKDNILGFVRITRFLGNKIFAQKCNPHYHCILVVSPNYFSHGYIKQAEWVQMWHEALCVDYNPIVFVQSVKSNLESVLLHCMKPTKVTRLNQESFSILDNQVRGIRQYNKGGLVEQYKPLVSDNLDSSLWEKIENGFYEWYDETYLLKVRDVIGYLSKHLQPPRRI
ncbi:protein rep [Helicobacter gastrofelis]|uniref:protein rep n=2 Tax=Helicobacter TaxID=209 RepID=UPI001C845B53|nr:protein rep [Helicobacter sp. NHP19-012]